MTKNSAKPNLTIVRLKDIQNELSCSPNTAKKYRDDIKEHFDIRVITYQHLYHYFKIPQEYIQNRQKPSL